LENDKFNNLISFALFKLRYTEGGYISSL